MTTSQTTQGPTAAAPDAPASRWARVPWYVVPLAVYLLSRIADTLLLLVTARQQVDPSTLPPSPGSPPLETGTSYLEVIANWDGQWYRWVAEHGYPSHLPIIHGVVQQNTWAFYPLYPALVRLVMLTGAPYGVAASAVSLLCGGAAMCVLYRLLTPGCGRFAATLTVVALCTYPAAVSLQAGYTESLALLLVAMSLWCLRERRYGALAGVALLLALTRPIALPLALVAAVHWFVRRRRRDVEPFPTREAVRLGLVTVAIGAMFLIWPAVAALRTGRLDAYFATEAAWVSAPHGVPSWAALFVRADKPGLMVVVVVATLLLGVVLLRRPAARWGLELRTWAIAYALFMLVATPPITAVFRYALLLVVPWWPLPEIGGEPISARGRVALATLVGAVGLVTQYFWLHWLFIVGVAGFSHP